MVWTCLRLMIQKDEVKCRSKSITPHSGPAPGTKYIFANFTDEDGISLFQVCIFVVVYY